MAAWDYPLNPARVHVGGYRALLLASVWILRNTELLQPAAMQQELMVSLDHLLSALSSPDTGRSNTALIQVRSCPERVVCGL